MFHSVVLCLFGLSSIVQSYDIPAERPNFSDIFSKEKTREGEDKSKSKLTLLYNPKLSVWLMVLPGLKSIPSEMGAVATVPPLS